MKYILEYEADEPLEDVLMRTFTIDMEQFGDKVEFELVDNGKNIYVTKQNRKEFVDKYIHYLFEV